jgi:hypothetical protein
VKKWDTAPLLPIGVGGEQRDAGLGLVEPGRVRLLRNGLLVGPGLVRHAPDWVLADTCKNIAGPVENHAVCGIFPFTTQGGASAESAGIAFSFNATDDIVYLHQLDENGAILRTFSAFTSYTEAQPPQITGFEMFGKFYFADYSFNTASCAKGCPFSTRPVPARSRTRRSISRRAARRRPCCGFAGFPSIAAPPSSAGAIRTRKRASSTCRISCGGANT